MSIVDWIVMLGTLGFIVAYGTWKTRKNANLQDYLRGGNEDSREAWLDGWTAGEMGC